MSSLDGDPQFRKVRDTLVDALGLDDDDVQLGSRLEADLGAESIDFLDIVFRLEKNFSIKIPRGELFIGEALRDREDFVKDGNVTATALTHIRKSHPHIDADAVEKNPSIETIKDHYTVGMVLNFVRNKLGVTTLS